MDKSRMTMLLFVLILVTLAYCQRSQGGIVNPDSVIRTSVGRRATLRCIVYGSTPVVSWELLDKNITISWNRTMYYTAKNRFYVQNRYVSMGRTWDLIIRYVKREDDGYYKCSIKPNGDQIIVRLMVREAEVLPKPTPAVADFSGCCKKAGVSASCVKYCVTNVTDNYSMLMACSRHIKKILQCVADGRNHVACCLRRRIRASCTPLCVSPGNYDPACGPQVNKAMLCFAEGKGTIPSSPRSVSVTSEYDYLLVRWSIPAENAAMVTNYTVLHREITQPIYSVSAMLPPKTYWYNINTGVTYKKYEVGVVAVGKYGSSVPSPLTVITQGVGSPNSKENMTVSECCSKRKITANCKKLCASDGFLQLEGTDLVQCSSDIKIALACLSGGRNHTPCCLKNNVPEYCSPLCGGGGELPFDWSLSQCYVHFPVIDACRDEGIGKLPGAPVGVVLGQLTDTQAVISWQESKLSSAKPDRYDVIYTAIGGNQGGGTNSVITRTTVLIGLKPQTRYSVVVVAVNSAGTSMKSPALTFVTASRMPAPKQVPWTEPYNETDCCLTKGVPLNCIHFCNYSVDLPKAFSSNIQSALQCEKHLIDMLICASDGRNHTGCCIRNQVTPVCYKFCHVTRSTRLRTTDLVCNFEADKFFKCYVEGQDILPRQPENITVNSMTESSIELSWDLPVRGPTPTSYIVEYLPYFYGKTSIQRATTNTTLIVLQPLKSSMTFSIRVISVTSNGTSLPSMPVIARTSRAQRTTPRPPVTGNVTSTTHAPLPATIEECCMKYVPDKTCTNLCISGKYNKDSACSKHIFATMACHTEGRDHRGCCLDAWVPGSCVGSCRGVILPATINTAKCISYFNTIMACIKTGKNLPKKPKGFHVVAYGDRSIQVDWKSVSGVTYVVRWQRVDREGSGIGAPNSFQVSDGPYTIMRLSPLTRYRVEVLAKNKYGLSQATSTRIVWTKDAMAVAEIAVSPKQKIFDIGLSVSMKCELKSAAQTRYDFLWYRYTRSHALSSSNTFTIKKIDRHSEGLYTCMVKGASKDLYTVDYYLHVRRKPEIVSTSDDRQPLSGGATIKCNFHGFPDQVRWMKSGDVLTTGRTVKIEVMTSEGSAVLTSSLTVDALETSSFGIYTCNGTNRFGYAVANVAIKRMDKGETTIPPTSSATKAPRLPDNVKECCVALKVPKQCQTSCNLKLNISEIFRNVNQSACLGHINNLIRCAAAERNLTQCCSRRGVPALCHGYCHGTTPKNILANSSLLTCIKSADTILKCLEEGRALVPTPPLGIAADYSYKSNTIRVTWLPPARAGSGVDVYTLNYVVAGETTQYNIKSRTYTIRNVLVNTRYKIWVIARNEHGHSHSSRTILVNTTIVPAIPKPRLTLTNELYIEVTWVMPLVSVPWDYFSVAYKASTAKLFIVDKIDKSAISHKLGPLKPKTKYAVYVAAGNTNGESRSDAIYLTTAGDQSVTLMSTLKPGGHEATSRPAAKSGPSAPSRVGLGIGLTILIVAVIAAGVTVYFLRKRQAKSQERVTFENPSYSNTNQPVQIDSLPYNGDSTPSKKQFQYDTLEDSGYTNLDFTPEFTQPDDKKLTDIDNNNSTV